MLVSDRHAAASRNWSATLGAARRSGSRSSVEPCTGGLRCLGFSVPPRGKLVPSATPPLKRESLCTHGIQLEFSEITHYILRAERNSKAGAAKNICQPALSCLSKVCSSSESSAVRSTPGCKVCIKCKCGSCCRDSPFRLQTAQQTGERPV